MTFAACRDAQHPQRRDNHTMTKTTTTTAILEAVRTMPQADFDAKADQLLAEANAALMALQAMREARKAQG
jgi:hypothetical protein